jgi:hypothetical protein
MTTTPPSPYDPLPHWTRQEPPLRRRRGVWSALGVILAVALGVLGLLVVAGFVIVFIGLNNQGSNK